MNFKSLINLSFQKLNNELKEDLNGVDLNNDKTSNLLLKKSSRLKCVISNREEIILCGSVFVENFIKKRFPEIKLNLKFEDGAKIRKNSKILYMSGSSKIILAIERTILNFIQHLSSISTTTNKFVVKMGNVKTKLLDTRKTTIGLKKFEKYATFTGGAQNHRVGLYDDILIKDNHIKVLGNIDKVLKKIESKNIINYKIECESIAEVKKAIRMNVNYILLDNMTTYQIKKCIKLKKNKTVFEISGGISLDNISEYSKLGADYISTSKITNSPYSVDIGLDII